MKTYLVGGAVRDKLLGLPVKDKDWVVVGATVDDMLALNYKQVGKDFPVFLHPETKEEYALARTERKIGPGHRGFDFDSSASVTLEEDLVRRDLTINAMAETADGELIDPYGGQYDIGNGHIRHMSKAFVEDPLRVLRVARFTARFRHMGFRVVEDTMRLMKQVVEDGELESLTPERVWNELELALTYKSPDEFIRVLKECGALAVVLPEIEQLFGVPQPEKYHPEIDTGEHILLCLQQARKLTDDPAVLYATLVHDVGKGLTAPDKWPSHIGHETAGLDLLNKLEERLPVPKEFAALAKLVCEHHTKLHRVRELKPSTVLRLLENLDAIRRPERLDKFLLACEADARGRTGLEDREYPQREYLSSILTAVQTMNSGEVVKSNPDKDPKEVVYAKRLEIVTAKVSELRND